MNKSKYLNTFNLLSVLSLLISWMAITHAHSTIRKEWKPTFLHLSQPKILPSVQEEDDVVLTNGLIRLLFNGPQGSFGLKGIYALFNKETFVYPFLNSSDAYPFWQVEYRDRQGLGVVRRVHPFHFS
jgi:hypothetical protein